MEIKIIKDRISKDELKLITREQFGNLIKAVVDVEKEIMAIGGYHHEDERELLIKQEGSKFEDLWGINLYPEKNSAEFIEYNSLINIRPKAGNRKIDIEIPEIKEKIKTIINEIINYD